MAGLMRGLYSGVMAGLQIKASGLSKRFGRRALLVKGTTLAGIGYLLAGQAGGIVGVCAALAFSGMGASTQNPLASSLVADIHQDPHRNKRWPATIFLGISARCWYRPWWAYRSVGLAGDKA
jgi:MFS family permease